MRRLLFSVLLFAIFGGHFSQSQVPDDTKRKRELFLKSREQMRTLPPDPEPTAAPKPRTTPRPTPTPEETPDPTPSETPTPQPAKRPRSIPFREKSTPPPATPPPSTPTPAPPPPARPPVAVAPAPAAPITIRKSGGAAQEIVPPPRSWWGGPKYRYVTGSVRKGIDAAPVQKGRWKYIVVHNSGTRQGNAKIFDFYHRHTRKMPNGLAYHFVIGNGTSTGDGQIELGPRWIKQINGGHVHSDYLNYISLGICLVGDFNHDRPTKNQLESLDELIRYLRSRCGKVEGKNVIVRAHKEINPVPTDCPGDRFPIAWLHHSFD